MRTLAVLPVKRFGDAKQRLSGMLGGGSRQALAEAMLADVLTSLRRVRGLGGRLVVTADRDAASAARGRGFDVVPDRQEAGQSAAALAGVELALKAGYERVLLVPGDVPLLAPGEVEELLTPERAGAVIVPDRHGEGTNALVLAPPDALRPSFGPGSLARHVAAARSAGLPHAVQEVPSLALDVDTPDDLAALASALEAGRGTAGMTRGALAQLGRSQAHARAGARGRGTAEVRA